MMERGKKHDDWQTQIEQIIKGKFPDDVEAAAQKFFERLMTVVITVQKPSDYKEKVIGMMLEHISRELYPLAAAYASFQLGVAYERCLNAERNS